MSRESRAPRIKNRAPAQVQVTAEQLLREAQERQEVRRPAPKQRIEDFEELQEYRSRKRQEFEEQIRRTRQNISAWMKYATWEATQGEIDRSRSIFERALDVDPHHVALWIRYTEMELKNRNVQHTRNLFDRCVTILPRVDQLWYQYVHLEELLGNVAGARQVFERWMAWEPDEKAWQAYIKMEMRYDEWERAGQVWERCISVHPEPRLWIKWARFEEEDRGDPDRAREIFQMALDYFGDEEDQVEKAQSVYTNFAKMEVRLKEYDRARVIYKYALSRLPRSKSSGIYSSYTRFEKQFGDRSGIEDTVLGKRRIQYEEELAASPNNYDTWFDYTRLEEDAYRTAREGGDLDEEDTKMDGLEKSKVGKGAERVREMYERAVAQVPPGDEKRHWRRYIFLWLNYALFEEMETKDFSRAREIYKAAIALVPHKKFTFAKLWLQYARFEIRRLNLDQARKILGAGIGMAPKERLFRGYIDLEIELREFDRARKLYERCLEWDPSNCRSWIKYTELERPLDTDRARAIFELAVAQPSLDMPEVLWKAYIDFEFDEADYDCVRELYERLLERTSHVKVWIAYALGEMNIAIAQEEAEDEEDEDEESEEEVERSPRELTEEEMEMRRLRRLEAAERARKVFERGYKDLKDQGLKEERVVLLEAWKTFEGTHGTPETVEKVEERMPRVVKKRKTLEDGTLEEAWELVFKDEEKEKATWSLLEAARNWKAKQEQMQAAAAAAAASVNGEVDEAKGEEEGKVDADGDAAMEEEDADSQGRSESPEE